MFKLTVLPLLNSMIPEVPALPPNPVGDGGGGGVPTTVNVVLVGPGSVGRAVVQKALAARDNHAKSLGLRLEFVAVVDSAAYVTPAKVGTPFDTLLLDRVLSVKSSPGANLSMVPDLEASVVADAAGTLSGVMEALHGALPPASLLLVDCSASDGVSEALLRARQHGARLVLANKRPLSGSQHLYDALRGADHRVRHEATVGAGLPVLTTLRRHLLSGDQVVRVEGMLSGTVGFILSGMDGGEATFSGMVKRAKSQGYTEPDPRDDLAGVDVARKALIIARELGWKRALR
jgi:homoserine dehydrogenase